MANETGKSRLRMVWKIFLSHLAILLVALITITWLTSFAVRKFHVDNLRRELSYQASSLRQRTAALVGDQAWEEIDRSAERIGAATATRVTILAADGRVLGDSELPLGEAVRERTTRERLARPEIRMALRQNLGYATRYSTSLRQNMLYVAVPFESEGVPAGFIRLARPLTEVRTTLQRIYWQIFGVGLTVAAMAGLLSLMVSRRITGPLEEIRRGAQLLADGELNTRLHVYNHREVGDVAEAMNRMAARLSEVLEEERRQKTEAAAVADSMAEGVIAIDERQRIIKLNPAAGAILGVNYQEAAGKSFQAVVQIPGLQKIMSEAARTGQPMKQEIAVHTEPETVFLQAHATPLQANQQQQPFGQLLVLQDVTAIRKLEDMRRQFVANVSHELRTPITSIRGALETILDGAIDNRREALRFIRIALRHTLRFDQLIHDLLLLSRLDQTRRQSLETDTVDLQEMLSLTVALALDNPAWKERRIQIECPNDIVVSINRTIFEQAILNLLNNALSYSSAETTVRLVGRRDDSGAVKILVVDQGCGIEPAHAERIFERFYRVDSARSRERGGTGLGLAIVKHVVLLHGGTIELTSQPGQGSTFVITLNHGSQTPRDKVESTSIVHRNRRP